MKTLLIISTLLLSSVCMGQKDLELKSEINVTEYKFSRFHIDSSISITKVDSNYLRCSISTTHFHNSDKVIFESKYYVTSDWDFIKLTMSGFSDSNVFNTSIYGISQRERNHNLTRVVTAINSKDSTYSDITGVYLSDDKSVMEFEKLRREIIYMVPLDVRHNGNEAVFIKKIKNNFLAIGYYTLSFKLKRATIFDRENSKYYYISEEFNKENFYDDVKYLKSLISKPIPLPK